MPCAPASPRRGSSPSAPWTNCAAPSPRSAPPWWSGSACQAALRQLAARFAKQQSARVQLRISPGIAGLSAESQEVIYRVAGEALQNAFKHSQATSVKLLLGLADKKIRLSVQDDGVGFSPETAQGKPLSFGLAGMQERAALLGGTLVVRSAPGKGATVILELPRASAKGVR